MMNEVTIDGVNVAECEFFRSKYIVGNSVFCECCTMFYNACINNTDCYFKQLQRAKAENEKLKAELDSCNNEFGCEEMIKIKAENENLKAENEKLKDFIKWLLKQQYYILHPNIKEKIKELILELSP